MDSGVSKMARPSYALLLALVFALALSATLPTSCDAKSSKRKAGAPKPPPSPKPSPSPPKPRPSPSPPKVVPSPPPPKAKSPPPSPKASPPPKSPPPAKSPPPPKSSPAPVASPPPAGPTPQPTTTCTTHAPMTQGRWVSRAFDAGFTSSCPFISSNFKCSSGSATQYSWQPNTCNLPTFNPSSFATRYAGKTILLVGDSIMKNMFEALACIIEQSSPVASDPVDFKSTVQFVERYFIFTGLNNLTLILVKDVYLSDDYTAAVPVVRQAWRSLLLQSSLAVFTTGHWYLHNGVTTQTATAQLENMSRSLGAYLRTLSQAPTNWQGTAALLTYTPVHKSCASFSRPFSDSEYTAAIAKDRADDMTAAMLRGIQGFPEVKIVDVTDMSFWRIDAHGPNDCSHWCTPGIPSVWLNMLNVVI